MKCKAFERRQAKADTAAKKLQDLLRGQAMRQEEWTNAARNSLLNQLGGNSQHPAMNAGMANRYEPGVIAAVHDYPRPRAWWEFWK